MKLDDFFYSADGQLQLIFKCPKDQTPFTWEPFASQLQEWARLRDLERFFKEEKEKMLRPGKAIRPPLGANAPKPTDKEKKFLRDIGIDPGSL
jgi:hypothetical protein